MLRNPEFWVLISFLLFLGLFGRQLWRALTNLLDGRAASVRAELEEAGRLRREAERMLRDAEIAQESAQADARDLLARTTAEAARLADAAHKEAEAAAARRERMALDRIAAAEAAAVTEIRQLAADLATKAARIVIASGLTADEDASIIDDAIAQLPRALRAA